MRFPWANKVHFYFLFQDQRWNREQCFCSFLRNMKTFNLTYLHVPLSITIVQIIVIVITVFLSFLHFHDQSKVSLLVIFAFETHNLFMIFIIICNRPLLANIFLIFRRQGFQYLCSNYSSNHISPYSSLGFGFRIHNFLFGWFIQK